MKKNNPILIKSIFTMAISGAMSLPIQAYPEKNVEHQKEVPLGYQIKVELNAKNSTLSMAFKTIEKQTNYRFVFNAKQINIAKSLSLNLTDKLENVLKVIGHMSGTNFEINGRNIIVTPAIQQQLGTLEGRVVNEKNLPVSGVSILIQELNQSLLTDENGFYQIKLPPQVYTLVYKHIAYTTLTKSGIQVISNKPTEINLTIQTLNNALDEVVVTALGIKKDSKKLGYSVQEIKNQDITKVPTNNFASQLSGKVAGLTVFNSPNLMQETKISLRGNQPLIVIDGIPVNSNTYDIDPDDIANVTVLKGATGASLYGSKGQNGVIQISTKKGNDGTSIEFSQKSIFRAGWIVFPETQHAYGNGEQGKYAYVDGKGNGTFDNDFIWGPKLDQKDPNTSSGYWETPQWDSPLDNNGNRIPTPFISRGKRNLENFLENGYTLSNHITVSKSSEKNTIRLGMGYDYTNGEVPSTELKNYNASLNTSSQVTEKLKLNASFQYNNQNSPNFPRTTYGNTNILYGMLVWAGKDVNMEDFKKYWKPGRENYEQIYFNYSWINNPYYMAHEQTQSLRRNKLFGVASAEYKINDNWDINLRQSAEVINATNEMKYPFGFIGANAIKGNYEVKDDYLAEYNTDLFIKYNNKFGRVGIDGFVGGSINYRESNWHESKTQGLQVPNIYNLSNSAGSVISKNNLTQYARNSAFASLDLSFDDTYFITLSERLDQSSALPQDNNVYSYPSVSGSILLSNILAMSNNYLKIRGSWAQVRADLAPYQYQTYFNPAITYDGLNSVTYASILGNQQLRPQKTEGIELGINGSFLNNKFTFDATAYRYIDSEAIFDQEASLASGFSKYKINGNRFRREGLELVLGYRSKLSENTNWNTTVNWSTNRIVLDEIYNHADNLAGIRVGERMDSYLTNNSMQKTADGQLIIGTNGLPIRDNTLKNLGHIGPDWTIGWNNEFSLLKNWNLSFLIEARIGGIDQANLNRQMWYSGAHPESIGSDREAYNRGEDYIAQGVNITDSGYKQNTYPTKYKDFVEQYWYRMNGESNVFDLSFVKLREVSIGYTLPQEYLNNLGKAFKSLSFNLIGSNLFMISDFPYSDPDIGNGGMNGNQLQFPSTRNIGFNINVKF